MIVFADADAVQATHVMEFYRLLGGGRRDAGLDGGRPAVWLAVLPGVTHYNILSSTMVADLVKPFLDSQTTNASEGIIPAPTKMNQCPLSMRARVFADPAGEFCTPALPLTRHPAKYKSPSLDSERDAAYTLQVMQDALIVLRLI